MVSRTARSSLVEDLLLFFGVFFSLSVAHRFLAFSELNISGDAEAFKALTVGVMSDLWVTSLATAFQFVFVMILKGITPRRVFPRGSLILCHLHLFVWFIMIASHQSYVDFFRQQISAFHLSYMTDLSFIRANNQSLATTETLILFLVMVGASFMIQKIVFRLYLNQTWTRVAFVFLMFIIAPLAHAVNIKYRVQWFVAEAHQMHFLERLYADAGRKRALDPLTEAERQQAQTVHESEKNGDWSKETKAFKAVIDSLKEKNITPHVIVLLAESFRVADTGFNQAGETITPNYLELAKSGVEFSNAYSTGMVTRGGQEAVWCGVLSSQDYSFMRSFSHKDVTCLPRGESEVKTFWFHGGDPRFDQQASFWTMQSVDQLITNKDFPPDAPSTGWGVSDRALFKKVTETLGNAKEKSTLSMVLSVTNHIPWSLPKDAPESITSKTYAHPQYASVSYFDFSLGEFVKDLKDKGLWENSILIVVGDHGNLEPSFSGSYDASRKFLYQDQLSHVNLLLSGGITEDLKMQSLVGGQLSFIDQYVSQTQIAGFLLRVLGISGTTFYPAGLFESRSFPVLVDLNHEVYAPSLDVIRPKEDVFKAPRIDEGHESIDLAIVMYRSYLHWLFGV